MITLLMALFIVMFAISSVNTTKFKSLSQTLHGAFSGGALPGGKSLKPADAVHKPKPIPQPSQAQQKAAAKEANDFEQLKRKIDAYSSSHHLRRQIQATITKRGLVVRILTDRVLFDSGQAVIKPAARPLLFNMAQLLRVEAKHPIQIEGYTDAVPIRNSVYPTNWELSTARATTVVRRFIQMGVQPGRLGAAGYAALHPVSSNGSATGRSRNRRVQIVLLRQHGFLGSGGTP